jgi:DNA repair exonuclease SbcCD ATPase subunit
MKTKLLNVLSNIIKEEVEDVKISAEDYMKLLKRVNYQAQAIPKLPKFKGKRLVVMGDVNLRGEKKITDLGPITIDGKLDVTQTNIRSLDHTNVTGYSSYWQTPYERVIHARRQAAKMEEQKERRKDGDWDINNTDDQGLRANLVHKFALNEGHIEELDDVEKERIEEIKREIKGLEDEEEYTDEIQDKIDELEDELSDLLYGKYDVYYFYPSGTHYSMDEFELLEDGARYAIGTYDEAIDSLKDYYEEWIDHPDQYLNNDYLSYYIDEEAVVDDARYNVENWVRDSPEDYGVERTELSSSQEEEISELEDKINELQSELEDLDSDEDEDRIEEIQEEIEQYEMEIQDIRDYPEGDYDEDEIERAIEDYLDSEVRYDAARWILDHGYSLSDYVDKDGLLDALVDEADFGEALNGYDGTYDEIRHDGETYILMRIDT